MLNCPMCTKKFRRRWYLNLHMVSHTKEKPHKCTTCSATFGQPGGLKAHMKNVHEGIKHVRKKNMECHVCSYKCSWKSVLKAHLRKHLADPQFSCSTAGCDFKTNYKTSLHRHVQAVHNHERPYGCTMEGCNYRALKKSKIDVHLKAHSNVKPFICEVEGCDYATKTKYSLKLHTGTVHQVEKPFKCSNCDFRTVIKSRLRRHEDGHNNIQRFRCHFSNCDFATQRNESLQLHIDCKHRTKAVVCKEPGCNFRCGSIALLKLHVRRNHVLPILKCPDDSCNFSTRTVRSLRLHLSRRHQDLPSGAGVALVQGESDLQAAEQVRIADVLICPFPTCDYQNQFQHRYERHMKTHDEKNRKHVCKLCSYRFVSPHKLELHLLTRHVREKPYSCAHCDYTTVYSGKLRRHAQKAHHIYVSLQGKKINTSGNARHA